MRKYIWILLIGLLLPIQIRGAPVFFFDSHIDSATTYEVDNLDDWLILWRGAAKQCSVLIPDDTASGGNGGVADSTFQVVTATDYFRADTVSAPSDTSAGNFYFDKEDSNFYFYTGLVWMPMDTGATVTEQEIEDYIFDSDVEIVYGPWSISGVFDFLTNPKWNANAIPDSALQDTVSLLGQIIETGEIQDRAIDSSKVLWGSSGDSIDLDIIPDGQSYRKMTLTEGTKLSGIETGADVTDYTNVNVAGAMMDSLFLSDGLLKRSGGFGSYAIITDASGNWNIAYGWGDHSTQNYFDRDTDDSDSLTEGTTNLFEDLTDNNIDELSNVKSMSEVYGDVFWFDTTGTDGWNRRAIGTGGQVLSVVGGVPDWGDYPDTLTIGMGGEVTAGATVSIEPAEIDVSGGSDGDYIRITSGVPIWTGPIPIGDLPSEVVVESELMDPDSIATNLIPDHADSNRDLGSSSDPWNDVYADTLRANYTVDFPNNSVTDAMVSNTLTASKLGTGTDSSHLADAYAKRVDTWTAPLYYSSQMVYVDTATYSALGVASFSSDNFFFTAGNISIKDDGIDAAEIDFGSGATQVNTDQVPEDASPINMYITEERTEDYTGGMVTGNTETRITVTYQDDDGTIDFVVDAEQDTIMWQRADGHLYPRTSTDTLGTEAHPIPLGWFDAIEGTSSTAYIDLDSGYFNHLVVGNVSDVEFSYLDTVTSCIQGQLDGKVTQDTIVDSLIFYPEYGLIDSNSATGGVTITSDAELTSNTYYWFYHITSDSTALQRRDIHKVWNLPHDLVSLDSVKGYYRTGVVGTSDNAFCLQLFKNGTGVAQTSDTTASTSWATKDLLSVGSWSAGQTAVFIGQCFVKSTESAYTRMSKIVAYYNRKKY